jgi:hypothetical protein
MVNFEFAWALMVNCKGKIVEIFCETTAPLSDHDEVASALKLTKAP